jgi:hypothetical protein
MGQAPDYSVKLGLPASPRFQTRLTDSSGVHPFSWVKGFCLTFLKKDNYVIKKGRLC